MEEGIVYVIKNQAFPNLVKIGITTRKEVKTRMRELYTTGVPFPFECVYAGKVEDPKRIEGVLHHAFSHVRVNPSREFFDIDESQAIAVLKLIIIEDVTPVVSKELDKVDKASKDASLKYSKTKRPNQNFIEMGLEIGESLLSDDGLYCCKVISERTVEYNGEVLSLTKLNSKILAFKPQNKMSIKWLYKGKSLKDIYYETYA